MHRQMSNSSFRAGNSASELRAYEPFEPVTEKVLVMIRSSDREEKSCVLDVHISMSQIASSHHQVLAIEITDEQDPFFLYAMEIGEQEFHSLKHEQSLLVDFLTFPHKLLELLRMSNRNYEESPKLIYTMSRINAHEATFNIIETNLFKQLVHLSLRFRSGNDEIIKTHLASRLKEFKASCEDLQQRLNQTEESLELRTAQYNDISRQYQTVKIENDRRLEERRLEDQEKLTTVRQQMLDTQLRMQNQFDYEKRALEEKYQKQLDETTGKLEHHQNKLNDLLGNKSSLEGTERELSSRVRQLEHELDLANNELTHLRTNHKSLETTKFEQEKALTEYRIRQENLERQLQDKDELNQKLTVILDTNSDFKSQQDDTVALLKATVSKLEDKLNQSATEINKGNSIIQKLQSEIKSGKQKLKLKNTVVMQQENVIQQKQDQLDMQEKHLFQLKRDVEKKDDSLIDQERTVAELRLKLEDAQKSMQQNVQSLQWMNNRVNELEKARLPYTSTYKPSTTTATPTSFKPSGYNVESFRSTTPRTPISNQMISSGNEQVDSFPVFKEPIRYKEPHS